MIAPVVGGIRLGTAAAFEEFTSYLITNLLFLFRPHQLVLVGSFSR